MGSVDSIPVVSQVKSAVQAISGDTAGAKKTQENFVNGCPVVSQVKSLVQVIGHDPQGARNTQKIFAQGMGDMADGIPVIGHVKGAIQYAIGDTEAGDRSMKAASRTTAVIGGAVGGFFVGGPVGAVAGAVLAGAAMDGIITGIDSAVHHEYRPYGEVAAVTNMVHGHHSAGEVFDFAAGIGFDALAGLAQGMEGSISHPLNFQKVYRVSVDETVQQAVRDQQLPLPHEGGELWVSEDPAHSKIYQAQPTNPPRSRNVMEIVVDKKWYDKMKKNDLIAQRSQNLDVQRAIWQAKEGNKGRTPNLWNNERLAGNELGNGKISIGIKLYGTFQVQQIQRVSGAIQKILGTIDNLSEAAQLNKLKEIKGRLNSRGVHQQLMNSYPEFETKIGEVSQQLSDRIDQNNLAEGKTLAIKGNTILKEFLTHVEKQTSNLYMFRKHIRQIRTIDITKWPYTRVENSMRFIAKHGPYAGAVITCWGPRQHSGQREEGNSDVHSSGPEGLPPSSNLASYSNANTTQVYKAGDVVLDYFSEQLQPIVDNDINIGGLIPKNVLVTFLAKSKLKNSQVILRLWKYSANDQHIDILMTSKGIGENFELFEYKLQEKYLRYLEVGGTLQVYGVTGKEEGSTLQVKQLQVKIDYGDPIAKIKNQGQNSIFTFQDPFTVQLTGRQKDQLQELFAQIFPCSGHNVYSYQVSYESILKGSEAQIFLMWQIEGKQKMFGTIPISKVFQDGLDWRSHNQKAQGLKIPEGSNLRLVAKVKHGEQLSVKNMRLNIYLRPKSQRVQNSLTFERAQQIFKQGYKDQLVDLFPHTLDVTHQVSNVRIRFLAKDQGFGNRKGRVFLSIYRGKQQAEENILLTPATSVQHDWKQYFFNSYNLKNKILKGDTLKIRCIVGGGGGHQLYVKDFFFFMTYRHSIRAFTPYNDFYSENNNGQMESLYPQKIACGINAVLRVDISFQAKDQGWGYRKGRTYMRIKQGGKVLQDVLLVGGDGSVDHDWREFNFVSESIGDKIPPGSVLQFMAYCGAQGGHRLYVKNFKAFVTFSDHPRDESIILNDMEWNASKKILCLSKLKSVTIDGQFVDQRRQKVNLLVLKNDGTKRDLIQILNENNTKDGLFSIKLSEAELKSKIAMTDRIEIAKQGPQDKSLFKSFALRVKFSPLQYPYHEALTIQFSPQMIWKAQDGKEAINVVGQNHGFQVKGKLLAAAVSCTWKDNQAQNSTGKLFLIQKSKEGVVKTRLDIFGTVRHDWCNMLARYDSDSEIVQKSQPGDQLFLQREVGQNGELYVDNLEIVLIFAP